MSGPGRTEAVEGLIGKKDRESGKISIDGKEIRIRNPIEAKKNGIAYVPSDRKQEGLVLIHSVKDNLTVTMLENWAALSSTVKKKRNTVTLDKQTGD